jgi:tetratricopeptide (TPR) repeat protein
MPIAAFPRMELVPITPPPESTASDPAPMQDLPLRACADPVAVPEGKPARLEVDVFLAQAASEYRQGRVDQALWDETAKQFGGDKQATVAAYLRVRARTLKRKKSEDDARKSRPTKAPANGVAGLLARPRVRYGIGGAIGVTAVVVAWLGFRDAAPPPAPVVAASAPRAAAAPRPSPSKPAPISVTTPSGRTEAGIELETKVRSLENAANWNVLVLYAAEWTRKEPESGSAWTSLSGGYRRLGQLDDALEAGKKAVTLAPADLNAWRNLGYIEIALERLPEARSAFDNALTVNAEDADALCGAARVASAQSRAKEAAELMSRVARTGTRCEDTSEALRAAAYTGAAPKSASAAR